MSTIEVRRNYALKSKDELITLMDKAKSYGFNFQEKHITDVYLPLFNEVESAILRSTEMDCCGGDGVYELIITKNVNGELQEIPTFLDLETYTYIYTSALTLNRSPTVIGKFDPLKQVNIERLEGISSSASIQLDESAGEFNCSLFMTSKEEPAQSLLDFLNSKLDVWQRILELEVAIVDPG